MTPIVTPAFAPDVSPVVVLALSVVAGVLVAVALGCVWEEIAAIVVDADVLAGAVVEFYRYQISEGS